ncbi:J domain-containing protein [Halolamina sp.]|uniref:J domain-containing protein n=1 Tax=Halolamina sp. TaxID=1940283 RepID=UPI0035662A0D
MSSLDWPAGWERTPAEDRERTTKFGASLAASSGAIETEMSRMDVDDFRASTASGGSYTKRSGLPKHNANPDDPGFVLRWTDNGEQFAVACDHYADLRDNVRSVYLWINETRLRSQRPVRTGDAEFAAARLPSGEEEDAVVATAAPHEVLEVAPDATDPVVEAAFKQKIKSAHPDQGGTTAEFGRVKDAKDAMLGGETA